MWHPKAQFPEELRNATKEKKEEYFNDGFILHHEMIDIVYQSLLYDFVESSEHIIALVAGPTGVGKSRLCLHFLADLYKEFDGVSDNHVVSKLPAVYVEAPVHSSTTFAWKDFYLRILNALYEMENLKVYGRPRVDGAEKGKTISTRSRTEQEIRIDVERRLQDMKTSYVLIDEIQHIFKYGGRTGERNLDILKSIANITGCRFVGFGTYEMSFSLERSAQLARRTKNIEFPSYSAANSSSMKKFASAYMGLLAHIPMQMDIELGREAQSMFVGSCGCVGILKQWCQRAMMRALNTGSDTLNLDHFKQTRLKASDLRLIAEEIKEGMAFFAEPDDSEIIELLGGVGRPDKIGNAEEMINRKPKRKPGKRKLGRDEVG